MVSTVHQTWGQERNFPSHRVGCLPARLLALALCRLEHLIHSPLYRKLSSVPDTFLLPSRASDSHWTFLSFLSTGAIINLSPLSCKRSFSGSKDPGRAPKCCAWCPNPWEGREKASKTTQLAKKGSLLLTRARVPAASNAVVQGQRAPSPSCYPNL